MFLYVSVCSQGGYDTTSVRLYMPLGPDPLPLRPRIPERTWDQRGSDIIPPSSYWNGFLFKFIFAGFFRTLMNT